MAAIVDNDHKDIHDMYSTSVCVPVTICCFKTHCISFYRTEDEKELLLTAYKAILGLIPKLKRYLPIKEGADHEYFYEVVNVVHSSAHTPCDTSTLMYITQMQGGCNTACSELLRWIKQNMFIYLGAGPNPIRIDLQANDKSMLGLNNPETGCLLILRDVSSMGEVFNNGVLKIWGTKMPIFLYKNHMYNPDNPEEGLFQGLFLVCVSPY